MIERYNRMPNSARERRQERQASHAIKSATPNSARKRGQERQASPTIKSATPRTRKVFCGPSSIPSGSIKSSIVRGRISSPCTEHVTEGQLKRDEYAPRLDCEQEG